MTQTLTTFYGANQNADTLTAKIKHVIDTETNILITHLSKDLFKQLNAQLPIPSINSYYPADPKADIDVYEQENVKRKILIYNPDAHLAFINQLHLNLTHHPSVALMTAGTADTPVMYEAGITVLLSGFNIHIKSDSGINHLDKTQQDLKSIEEETNCIITCQGFEGMLPCVIAGLTNLPIISVPTSTGYGVSQNGTVALNTSLSACTPGITTVNINNGFGAGQFAVRLCQQIQSFNENK